MKLKKKNNRIKKRKNLIKKNLIKKNFIIHMNCESLLSFLSFLVWYGNKTLKDNFYIKKFKYLIFT
jgi:cell division protein FtsB